METDLGYPNYRGSTLRCIRIFPVPTISTSATSIVYGRLAIAKPSRFLFPSIACNPTSTDRRRDRKEGVKLAVEVTWPQLGRSLDAGREPPSPPLPHSSE
ncbi:hypothetical protein NPIL_240121 [Nephila pilipes]|uniref:Uncharacterized protein n=1 Tax=Nephila pilipes TaxID=299642 RepID=A0A8X6MFM6_NEPPI|nr:hypothetical protein NPIL_240121 [Nephila pilipes]